MTGVLRLSWRYLAYHPIRTGILVICIALVGFLPTTVQLLMGVYERALTRRADATPMVVGAPGSRFDLLLSSLYFRGHLRSRISMREVDTIAATGLARPIPILVEDTARSYPVVGTSLDYFEFRGLRAASGTLPHVLGDAVLGAKVAGALEVGVDGRVLTDSGKLYDISSSYPLRMRVTGILEEAGTPDDWAVFVDIATAWVIRGVGHGHESLEEDADPALVLSREPGSVTANAAVVEYTEITPDNIDGFHFHGGPEERPVSAIIAVPPDAKSATILRARLDAAAEVQPIGPREVLDEMMQIVFRVKRFFDANTLLVSVATALFLALVILLTLKVRERERETLFKIGASRAAVWRLQAVELGIVLLMGAALSGLLVAAIVAAVLRGPFLFALT